MGQFIYSAKRYSSLFSSIILSGLLFFCALKGRAQISTFPYVEDFETAPSWTAVSVANSDWAWGTPNHTYVIQTAGSGNKCWSVGNLTGAFYNFWEQSYVKSPTFNFTNLLYPHIKFKLFYDCEYHYDGGNLQYSLNGGTTWIDVGTVGGTNNAPIPETNDCNTQNWYNYPGINYLNNPAGFVTSKHGWCGNTQAGGAGWDPTSPGTACVGGNGPGHWLTAEHCLTGCGGQPNVMFRFTFGAGFTCNNFDGFAFDSVAISNGIPNSADFTTVCGAGNTINFNSTFAPCPQTNAWVWNFGDPASGVSNTASTQNASHTYSGPGTYTVVLIAKGGACNPPDTITKVVSVMSAAIPTSTNVSCNGGNNGAAAATVSLGVAPLVYAWSPSGGSSTTASNLTAGNYVFTVTDANGCQKTSSVTITQPPPITAPVTTGSITCNGLNNGSATVTATGGVSPYSYTWSPSGGNATAASGLAAGNYSVTVQDANACTKTTPFTIAQPTPITASGSVTNPLCGTPGSATVTASGGTGTLSYSWAPSGGTSSVASSIPAGSYTAMVTDANGCNHPVPLTLTPSGNYTATISSNSVSCFGGNNGSATATVNGTSGPYTYTWSPSGGSGPVATGLAAGTYSLSISDANNCTSVNVVTITQPAQLTATSTSSNITCSGLSNGSATVTASGGTGTLSYNWAPSGSATSVASSLGAGSYTVTVQDANNCSKQTTFTITSPTPITGSSAVTNALCGTPGSATVIASGGTGALSYSWTPSGGTSSTASALAAGSYTTIVTDANGCHINVTSNIIASGSYTTTVASTSVSCFGGNNGSATASVTGSSSPYSYTWTPSGNTGAVSNNLAAGNYTVTVKDVNGCMATKTVTVIQPTQLTSAVANATVCNGQSAVVSGTVAGGTAPYTYQWLPSGASTPTLSVSPLTTTSYTLNVTDNNNCHAAPSVLTVSVLPPLSVIVNGPLTICSGSTAVLTATAGGGNGSYQYLWQPGNLTGVQISPVVNTNTQYTVTVSDGCTAQPATAVAQVNVIITPTIQIHSTSLSGCPPLCTSFYDSTLIMSNNITSWQWTFSNGVSSNSPSPHVCFYTSGNYTGTLSVVTNDGCTVTPGLVANINVHPVPVPDFTSNTFEGTIFDPIFNLTNASTNSNHVIWKTTVGTYTTNSITLNYENEGVYPVTLVAINNFGCKDSITRYIKVDPEFTFYAPNTFTPNHDAYNETFMPLGIGWKNDTYTLNIFDRWGLLIYRTNDVNKGWDGRMKGGGDVVQEDVYVWKVELEDVFNKHHSYIGHVTVLK